MQPLSAFKYIKNNKKESLILILAIAAGIVLIYLLWVLISSNFTLVEKARLKPLEYYSRVDLLTEEQELKEEIIEAVKGQRTDKIIEAKTTTTGLTDHFGSFIQMPFYFIEEDEIEFFFARMEVELKAGRLPYQNPAAQANRIELIYDQRTLNFAAKDWVSENVRYMPNLPFDNRIVGLVGGENYLNLGLWQEEMAHHFNDLNYTPSLLIFHQAGEQEAIEQELNQFLTKEGINIYTLSQEKEALKNNYQNFLYTILTITTLVFLLVLSIAVGNMGYLIYFQRQEEFALLSALGHSFQAIIKRIVLEVLAINFLGSLTGFMILFALIKAINRFFYSSLSLEIAVFDWLALRWTLLIPLFVFLAIVIPVSNLIKDIEEIDLIAGN